MIKIENLCLKKDVDGIHQDSTLKEQYMGPIVEGQWFGITISSVTDGAFTVGLRTIKHLDLSKVLIHVTRSIDFCLFLLRSVLISTHTITILPCLTSIQRSVLAFYSATISIRNIK